MDAASERQAPAAGSSSCGPRREHGSMGSSLLGRRYISVGCGHCGRAGVLCFVLCVGYDVRHGMYHRTHLTGPD